MTAQRTTLGGALLALVVSPLCAGAAGAEAPRVYTNADLERLEPLAVERAPLAPRDDAAWDFVAEFLARERERIDADRFHEIERRRMDMEQERLEERSTYGLAYYPYSSYYPYATDRGCAVTGDRRRHGPRSPHHAIGGPIVPLHARPSQAEVQRHKAIQRSGVDAFPSNARRARP